MLAHYWIVILAILPFLARGLLQTVLVSVVGGIFGSLLGAVLGIVRAEGVPVLGRLVALYVHLLRGTPFLVQLYLFYFVLPNTGLAWLSWDSETAAFVALSLYTSSYVCEIVRSAIEAVPHGQSEAATALGLRRIPLLWLVLLPQAARLALPSLSGVYVVIIKSTAVLSVVGISELTRQGEVAILRFPRDIMFVYGLVALLYFAFCYPVLRLSQWSERRLGGVRGNDLV